MQRHLVYWLVQCKEAGFAGSQMLLINGHVCLILEVAEQISPVLNLFNLHALRITWYDKKNNVVRLFSHVDFIFYIHILVVPTVVLHKHSRTRDRASVLAFIRLCRCTCGLMADQFSLYKGWIRSLQRHRGFKAVASQLYICQQWIFPHSAHTGMLTGDLSVDVSLCLCVSSLIDRRPVQRAPLLLPNDN